MTENEMIAELERIQEIVRQGPDDALTTREWMSATGLGEKTIRNRLHVAKDLGRLERVTVFREDLRGQTYPVVAYRLSQPVD